MPKNAGEIKHIGSLIRKDVIPADMSVSEAAKRLGVGRPALSNLLNGSASLSPEMALRLEKTFGADRNALLQRQADLDRRNRVGGEGDIVVRPYVPPFLQIESRQIDAWADEIDARHLLPVLLRLLIVSTHDDLSRVTFPGHDDAQRHGWDGLIEADSATPWIPNGVSYWEFGTSGRPGEKANSDYDAALRRPVPLADREESTFVFVTPRRWHGVTDWAAAKQREGPWKAVKALDASDLETWLTQSIPAQAWFAEQLEIATSGVETLQRFWDRWSSASSPKLTLEVFSPSLKAYRQDVVDWLTKEPEQPFVISADSKGEAVAFLACLFRELSGESGDNASAMGLVDTAAVFDSASTLRELAASRTRFLPIVRSDECERELAPVHRRLHCVTVRPRNAVQSDPDIALDLLNHEAFAEALDSMDIDRDTRQQLERESGRSPTILRRRLSTVDSIRTPAWAEDQTTARALIPLTLVGAWDRTSPADQRVVAELGNRPYETVEQDISGLLQLDDSPVWAVGQHCGVASKIDALFAISRRFTSADLSRFFTTARYVLAEIDPSLDLPADQRWAAELYGKVRDHSAALRSGICETLVILAVHGNNLFLDWPGINVEAEVSSLIRDLLTPLTLEKLLSHDRDLPRYAEAAPEDFLQLIEEDLRRDSPVIFGLLEPVGSGVFAGSLRTGLLWALESLAWKHVARVSTILARLARIVIADNLENKPINSLKAIYRSWVPQTTASLNERKRAIKTLADGHSAVAWQVCIDQLPDGTARIGFPSYRPRWRSDATGAGRGVTAHEQREFERHVLDIVHRWPKIDQNQVLDLVRRARHLSEGDSARVWDRVTAWGRRHRDEQAKAAIREQIRQLYLTRRGQLRNLGATMIAGAQKTFTSLAPKDLVIRHQWLFVRAWIEPSAVDVDDPNASVSVRQEIIQKQRDAAITEIWKTRGTRGLTSLLATAAAGEIVGHVVARVIPHGAWTNFLKRCLDSPHEPATHVDAGMQGFLRALPDDQRTPLLQALLASVDSSSKLRLLRCAPFRGPTWRLVEDVGQPIEDSYWESVTPQWVQHSELELTELIDRLLQAARPRTAFQAASLDWSLVETSRLRRLLYGVATEKPSSTDQHRLEAFAIVEALEALNGRAGVNTEDMATLEFMYIDIIDKHECGLPNLENQISTSPSLYFRTVTLVSRRQDRGEDPPDWRIHDSERARALASQARKLLFHVKRLPGTAEDGTVNLRSLLDWVAEVRRLCEKHDRVAIGDEMIGQLLGQSNPVPEDGPWPRTEVCEVLEQTATEDIRAGFCRRVQNARKDPWREEGGGPERQLEVRFRKLANERSYDYPFVAGCLERIADGYRHDARLLDERGELRRRLE